MEAFGLVTIVVFFAFVWSAVHKDKKHHNPRCEHIDQELKRLQVRKSSGKLRAFNDSRSSA